MSRTWILTGSPENHAATGSHWTLAFPGQIRVVSEYDADLLLERMSAAAAARA